MRSFLVFTQKLQNEYTNPDCEGEAALSYSLILSGLCNSGGEGESSYYYEARETGSLVFVEFYQDSACDAAESSLNGTIGDCAFMPESRNVWFEFSKTQV